MRGTYQPVGRVAQRIGALHQRHRSASRSATYNQKPRSLVQARVAKVQLLEFRLCPGRRFGDQGVRSKAESKRETPTVYKRCCMSLKVNGLRRLRRTTGTLCITTCPNRAAENVVSKSSQFMHVWAADAAPSIKVRLSDVIVEAGRFRSISSYNPDAALQIPLPDLCAGVWI